MTTITETQSAAAAPIWRRSGLILAAFSVVAATALLVGGRYGLLLATGLGFGIVLEGLRFGFAGPWRAMILRRDPRGMWAQLLSMALVTTPPCRCSPPIPAN